MLNNFEIGGDKLTVLAGPCAMESKEICEKTCEKLKEITTKLNINFVFKTSLDKANRSSINSYRGLGIEKGLYFPIQLIGVGSTPKEMRIRSYSMLVQNGFIRFPTKGCENIITQLTEFPMGAFDDLCDGLYLAIKAAEKGSTGNVAISSVSRQLKTAAIRIIGRARR